MSAQKSHAEQLDDIAMSIEQIKRARYVRQQGEMVAGFVLFTVALIAFVWVVL